MARAIKRGIVALLLVFLLAPVTALANPGWLDDFYLEGDSPPPGAGPVNREDAPPPWPGVDEEIPRSGWTGAHQVLVLARRWRPDMLAERQLTRRQEGLTLGGFIPVITEAFGPEHFRLNEHIEDEIVASLLNEVRRGAGARAVTFDHRVYDTDELVSIVIYAEVSSVIPRTLVRSVNFCLTDGRLLTMNEAAGMDIVPLAERKLAEMIRGNPEHYYAALSASMANPAFYMDDSRLVILFDGFRLSSRNGDVGAIELMRDNIRVVTIFPYQYHRIHGGYGLKMIPIRPVVGEDGFGYRIEWCPFSQRVEIWRGSRLLIEFHIGDNNYVVFGTQQRSLEAAPILIDVNTYVPITFFDQIMPLTTYSICAWGSITFLAYLDSH